MGEGEKGDNGLEGGGERKQVGWRIRRIEVRDTGSLTQNKMCISMLFPMMYLKMLCVLWSRPHFEFNKSQRKKISVKNQFHRNDKVID